MAITFEGSDGIAVIQTLIMRKSGANFTSVDAAIADFAKRSSFSKPSATLPLNKDLYSETKTLVDAETFKTVRTWPDWYDCEEYLNKRATKYDDNTASYYTNKGWSVTQEIERA